jgi:hypothetical protein
VEPQASLQPCGGIGRMNRFLGEASDDEGAFRPVVSARDQNISGAVGRLPRFDDAAFVPLAKRKMVCVTLR